MKITTVIQIGSEQDTVYLDFEDQDDRIRLANPIRWLDVGHQIILKKYTAESGDQNPFVCGVKAAVIHVDRARPGSRAAGMPR